MTMYYIQTVFLGMLIAFDEHHCPVDNQYTCVLTDQQQFNVACLAWCHVAVMINEAQNVCV